MTMMADLEQGEKFYKIGQDLNSTRVKNHSSSELYFKVLGSLELALLTRESQFKRFKCFAANTEALFCQKQNEAASASVRGQY